MKKLLLYLTICTVALATSLTDFIAEDKTLKFFEDNNREGEIINYTKYLTPSELIIEDYTKGSEKTSYFQVSEGSLTLTREKKGIFLEEGSRERILNKTILIEPFNRGLGWESKGYFYEILSVDTKIYLNGEEYECLVLSIDTGYETKIKEYYSKGLGIVKREVYFANRLINKVELARVFYGVDDIEGVLSENYN